MKTQQLVYSANDGWKTLGEPLDNPQLVLVFASIDLLEDSGNIQHLMRIYPSAQVVHASTSGEISQSFVTDNTIVATAIQFEKTSIGIKQRQITSAASAYDLGKSLFQELKAHDLAHILIISDGIFVNGSELVGGLNYYNSKLVPITGGLAGDGAKFEKCLVGVNNLSLEGNVVGIGFYGNHLKVGHGSRGGWDPFGPERVVTKSNRNVLYDLDNQSALNLYKKYLGPLSQYLPGSALQIPLSLKISGSNDVLVRTVLSIDEKEQSMKFAGNLPPGATVQLMKSNFEKMVDGASAAAVESILSMNNQEPQFALMISCVGRKIVLNHRIEEEVEEAARVLGTNTRIAGFYSNGEIAPLALHSKCELHNQTMTITTYSEV